MATHQKFQNQVSKLTSVISTPALVQSAQTNHTARLLRLKQVLELYPIGRSSLYKMIAEGRFPAQLRISEKSVAWREAEVLAFINSLQGVK